jgi:hypothetical protein
MDMSSDLLTQFSGLLGALNRIENARVDARTSTVDSMLRALAKAGIQFISENGYEGVRLRKRKKD